MVPQEHRRSHCPQLPTGRLPCPVWSADCLCLIAWKLRLSPQTRLSVIVYIHGDSNTGQNREVGPASRDF
jgi:carboxylesterase type B